MAEPGRDETAGWLEEQVRELQGIVQCLEDMVDGLRFELLSRDHHIQELNTPEPFHAVGLWYEDFSQTTDEEVWELLDRAWQEHPAHAS